VIDQVVIAKIVEDTVILVKEVQLVVDRA